MEKIDNITRYFDILESLIWRDFSPNNELEAILNILWDIVVNMVIKRDLFQLSCGLNILINISIY